MAVRARHPVRPGGPGDEEFLWEMLHEAARHRPVSEPGISRYLEGWGRSGDAAVISLDPEDGSKTGASWYRLFGPDDPGYGFVDASTPEVAIAVAPNHRGAGVGGALLRELLDTARQQGFGALSLSVRRDNRAAVGLYERNSFVRLSEVGSEHPSWVMRVALRVRSGE